MDLAKGGVYLHLEAVLKFSSIAKHLNFKSTALANSGRSLVWRRVCSGRGTLDLIVHFVLLLI